MASEDKKQTKKQVFDVAKPGKTPAEASSRPIIVTHKPMIEDPMVSKKTAPEIESDEKPSVEPESKPTTEVVSHGEKILAPLHDAGDEEPKTTEEKPAEEPIETAVTAETEQADTETNSESADSTANDINSAAEEIDQKKAQQEAESKASKEELEIQDKVTKLIEEKKYFVKVGETHHKRQSKSAGVILLFLFLVLIGTYIAIDVGLIKTNFQLPYDLLDEYFAKITWW